MLGVRGAGAGSWALGWALVASVGACVGRPAPASRSRMSLQAGTASGGPRAVATRSVVARRGRPSPLAGDRRARPRPRRPVVVQVRIRRTWVRAAPSPRAPRLGEVRRGARMASLGIVRGSGCLMGWVHLSMGGYLCGDAVRLVRGLPGGARLPVVRPGRVLPFRYVAVRGEGSGEYLQPSDAASDYYLRELAPRNAITVDRRVRFDGAWFWRTTRGTYVPTSDVVPIRGSRFAGQRLGGGRALPMVFVHRRVARWYSRPGRRARGWAKRFERFHMMACRCAVGARCRRGCGWVQIGAGRWLRGRDVRMALRTARPRGVTSRERWIDVDLRQQALVAYQGDRPVFTTLVSTGLHGRTPRGRFRVWAKLAATDMRSPPGSPHTYQLWDVPWTMFFHKGVALHGTYWHGRFGFRRSAGCINLSPRDARFLFEFTRPALPPGWWAVLPASPGQGTLIQIRAGRAIRRLP